MTVQDPRMHWAILSLMRVLSPWSETACLFLFCLESVLLTVDLTTLCQHLLNCLHYHLPSMNGLHRMLHEQRALWLIDTCSYTDNRGGLFFRTVSFFRAEAVSFILFPRWLFNGRYINKYVTLPNFRRKEEHWNHGPGVSTCHILLDTVDYRSRVPLFLFIPW